jgi:hypothetical protein
MTKYIRDTTIALGLLVGWLLVGLSAAQAQAASSAGDQIGTLASIEKSIVRAIGAEATTVKVTSSGGILLVARVNSNMNGSTHEGRNNEAQVIAPLVAKEIGGNQNFGNTTTIRVEYVVRSPPTMKNKIVDSVEFRKGPDGVFDFHQT